MYCVGIQDNVFKNAESFLVILNELTDGYYFERHD